MFWKKNKWHKAAATESEIKLNESGIGVVEIEGKKICICKYNHQWFAFAYNCPHAGGFMNEGYIDGAGNIICPVHGYKFSLKNGLSKWPEGFCLKTYSVEIKTEGVFIKM